MIETIILDVGNVMVDFDWKTYLESFGYSKNIYEKVADAMFRSKAWDELDRSAIPDEEILQLFIGNCPELEEELRAVFEHLGGTIRARAYASDWVRAMKDRGYRVYILSNYGSRTFEQTKDVFGFLQDVDGAVFSYEVQSVKPEPEIYEELLRRYEIQPERAVFIDDLQRNLDQAREYGIHTIRFCEFGQVNEELRGLGVEIDYQAIVHNT